MKKLTAKQKKLIAEQLPTANESELYSSYLEKTLHYFLMLPESTSYTAEAIKSELIEASKGIPRNLNSWVEAAIKSGFLIRVSKKLYRKESIDLFLVSHPKDEKLAAKQRTKHQEDSEWMN